MKRSITLFCTLLLLIVSAVPALASKVLADIEYFYADDGTLIGKAFNGKRVNFEYDLRGQLLAVKDAYGKDLERYTYDPAGNRLSKTINGVTTAYTYDKANQLVTSTVNGVTTHYKYDAAGRMIQAGDKKYIYNGNNKVVAIWQNGDIIAKFEYNIDGQISKAIYGDKVDEFMWDGLALIWRSGVTYINEPAITGGNPVMAGDDVFFNDMLGSTLAVNEKAVEMTSFGETGDKNAFFTGKPMIDELGYSFLFRDYNPNQGKWITTDPLGYPDGWNNLAYCNNNVIFCIDMFGGWSIDDVTYNIGSLSKKYIYGIVNPNLSTNDDFLGDTIIVVWEVKIHYTCNICLGPDCSTNQCYITKYMQSDANIPWHSIGIPSTPILSTADIVAAAIQGTVNYFTGYGQYVPIDEERLFRLDYYNAIPTPDVPKLSYAGRHCKE